MARHGLPTPFHPALVDLTLLLVLASLGAGVAFMPVVRETPLRFVLGGLLLLFVPGYALVAAVFPGQGTHPGLHTIGRTSGRRGIDGLERLALGFGASVCLLPLLTLLLSATPWRVELEPLVGIVGGFTVVCVGIAGYRRLQLPIGDRFVVPYPSWLAAAGQGLSSARGDLLLNGLLAVSVILATSSLVYAMAAPRQGEQFTGVSLLAANDSGQLVTGDYPTAFESGEGETIHVEVRNREGRSVTYTVVVELHRVAANGTGDRVLAEEHLDRFQIRVPANESRRLDHTVTPRMTGDRLRLTYLLYAGSPPEEPTMENAYRRAYLWITVSGNTTATPA
jgi:uncharacterized membrane protein